MLCLAGLTGWTAVACRERASARRELWDAYAPLRPTEGRLTGGLGCAPYEPGAAARRSTVPAVRQAERRLRREARLRPRRGQSDQALVELFAGEPGKAVAALERAVAAAPGDAALLSDLTAAYIARGGDGARPYDLVRALAAADRALRLEPHLQEALFNRALALGKLPLEAAARRAWAEVIAGEEDPAWKAEEGARLAALSRPTEAALWESERARLDDAAGRGEPQALAGIVARFPQPARLYAEEELLTTWADRSLDGRPADAEKALRIARAIGSALAETGRDPMVRNAVAAIDVARAEPAGERLRHLVQGHHFYGEGVALYKGDGRSREPDRALALLDRAAADLRQGGSPFAGWADLYAASAEYFRAHLEPARERLERLRRSLPPGRYPSLEGRITLVLASIDLLRGRPGDALPRLLSSRLLFQRGGEDEDLSSTLQHLTRVYRLLGETEEAWKYLCEGLRQASRLRSSRRLAAILEEAGLASQEGGHPEVAFYFQNETVANARRLDDPEMLAAARRRRALTLLRTGRAGDAREEIAAAQQTAARIPNESLRRRLESEILIARGEIGLASDPRSAAGSLTAAIRYFSGGQYHLYLPLAHLLRARARLAGRDEPGAEADFRAGLAEIQAAGASVLEPRLRIALHDQAAALVDETLAALVRRGKAEDAFLISEQGRARQLLESLAVAALSASHSPLPPDSVLTSSEIRRELPAGVVLVKYAALEDRLLIWTLARERESFRQVAVPRAGLARAVARTRAGLLAKKERRSIPELRQLSAWLVAPLAADLAGAREIVFVPDRELFLLPFAALSERDSGSYLVEDRELVVSPSANVYVRCLRRLRAEGPETPTALSALVIGATDFDRERFPSLAPLREAEKEAALVAARYRRHWLLTGPGATRERFFAEMAARQPAVLHFAGHSVLNPSSPELSMLLLAPGPEKTESGAVYSHEIYGLRPEHLRLVVLATCDAAAGKLSASEGALGLVRPFLAAGVPTVLASLGAVQDDDSLAIVTMFHQRLQTGDSPAAALRAAQRSRIARTGREAAPGRWALYEVLGASAPIF